MTEQWLRNEIEKLKAAIPWIIKCKANRGAVEYNKKKLALAELALERLLDGTLPKKYYEDI